MFEVAVASPYDYQFAGARNYVLKRSETLGAQAFWTVLGSLKRLSRGAVPFDLLHSGFTAGRDVAILKRALREFRPDVVFLQTLLYPGYLGFAVPRSVPLMITFWNGDVTWWAKWDGIERLLKKYIVQYGARRAAAITVNSQAAFDACIGYGAEARNIHVIRYPGVDLQRFQPMAKEEARAQIGLGAECIVFCPRGLGGYLNSDVIIEAIPKVAKLHPGVLFLFASGVGGDSELGRHQQMARALGVEEHCRWEGQLDWEVMPLYYNASDVMVSVSSKDSLPNCMLEAMACGVPVVMGDIPAIREWVTDEENGFLVACRDSAMLAGRICTALDGRDRVGTFREKNLRLVQEKADGRKNNAALKELVRRVCRGERVGHD